MLEFEGGEVKIFQKYQSLLTPYLYSSGYEIDTPLKGAITSAISQKKFPGRLTALDTTWDLANKIRLLKWETENAEEKRHKRASARGEAPDKLRAEIQTPKLNQRGTASTVLALS